MQAIKCIPLLTTAALVLLLVGSSNGEAMLNISTIDTPLNFNDISPLVSTPEGVIKVAAISATVAPPNGQLLAQIQLSPKCFLSAHTHPRAAEILYLLSGSNVTVVSVQEVDANGQQPVVNVTLQPGMVTAIPPAILHTIFNFGDANATLLSIATNENPGHQFVLPALYSLSDTVATSLFNQSLSVVNALRGSAIGALAPVSSS